MLRRRFCRLIITAALLPLVEFKASAAGSQTGSPHLRLTRSASRTLIALAETILPPGNSVPGAAGEMVVTLVSERVRESREWQRFYLNGLISLEAYTRRKTARGFAGLAPAERADLLTDYWSAVTGKSGELFLNVVKQDALNELFTTRAGLKWLGYRGKKEAQNLTTKDTKNAKFKT